jgi:hypothetical protein
MVRKATLFVEVLGTCRGKAFVWERWFFFHISQFGKWIYIGNPVQMLYPYTTGDYFHPWRSQQHVRAKHLEFNSFLSIFDFCLPTNASPLHRELFFPLLPNRLAGVFCSGLAFEKLW